MMKRTILFLSCILLSLTIFAQTKNRVSFFYGYVTDNGTYSPKSYESDSGTSGKGASLFEVNYSRRINSFFALETGLQYSHSKIETHSFSEGITHYKNFEINLLSVPVYGNLTFLKYFFVEAGPIVDIEFNANNSQSIQDQSGIGLGFGLGGKYTFKRVSFIVNPFLQNHLMLLGGNGGFDERLCESGIKFGIGYNF